MIFATDDRQKLDANYPDGRFVQILSTFPNGTVLQASGAMIGANDILTAAHAFYSHENGGLATSVEITPSRFNDYKPFGITTADHLYLSQEWIQNASFQYDYGVISLATPIGFQTGWFDYGYIENLLASSATQMVSYGYAGDIQDGEWLTKSSGTPDAMNGTILLFRDDLDLSYGQSGSPVLAKDNNTDVIIGVVSHHNSFPNENGIYALNKQAVANIEEWVSLNDENLIQLKSSDYSFENVQSISLLYLGLLLREPDKNGLDFWLESLKNGLKYEEIANGFLTSSELISGSSYSGDNSTFVTNLYKNILDREPDTSGYDYWMNFLEIFSQKEAVVTSFLESVEYKNNKFFNSYKIWHNWYESFSREIHGSQEGEILLSSDNDDYINAGSGDDIINAQAGDDYIISSAGSDTMTGGEGKDFFVFDLNDYGADTITDFDLLNDKLIILSSLENLSVVNIENDDTLVLYQDENSYIILEGLTKNDLDNIFFV